MTEQYNKVLSEIRELNPEEAQIYFEELANTISTYRDITEQDLETDPEILGDNNLDRSWLYTWGEVGTYDAVLEIIDETDNVDGFLLSLQHHRNEIEEVFEEAREEKRKLHNMIEDVPKVNYEPEEDFYDNPVDQIVENIFQPVLEKTREEG